MDRARSPSATWEHHLNIFSRCKASSKDCSTGVGFWRLRLHACFYYSFSSARLLSCVWTSQCSGLPCTYTNEYLCIKHPQLMARDWCPWHWFFPPGDALSSYCSSSFHWITGKSLRSQPQGTRIENRPAAPYFWCPALPYPASSHSPGGENSWELCFLSKQYTAGGLVHCRVLDRPGNTSSHRGTLTLNFWAAVTEKFLSTLTLVTSVHLRKTIPVNWWRTTKWGWSPLTLQCPVMPEIYTNLGGPTTLKQIMQSSPPTSIPCNRARIWTLDQ